MNQVLVSCSPQKIEMIVERNIRIPEDETFQTGVLNKGGSSALNEALAETWDEVKNAFNKALYDGWEAAKEVVQKVKDMVKENMKDLGQEADVYRDRLVEQIHDCLNQTYSFMISSLQKEIVIAGTNLPLQKVDIEFKMVFSGSIELSLTSLCKMIASGELVVKGSYAQ